MTATAGFDVPSRRLLPADAERSTVVVKLHSERPLRPRSPFGGALPGSDHHAEADLDQLTRAVHALVEALVPGVIAEVSLYQGPRQPSATGRADSSENGQPLDLLGDDHIRLDRRSRTLLVDGTSVMLTRREFELLAHLAAHPGVAMSRRELMTAVWHESYLPGDRTVDVHIRRVRVKLGAHAGRLQTLRGFGYRFD